MNRTIMMALAMTLAAGAMAGQLTLNTASHADLYDLGTLAVVASDANSNSAGFVGAAINQSLGTSATASALSDTAMASNSVGAMIASEGNGMFMMTDTLACQTFTYGPEMDVQGSSVLYTFNLATAAMLNLSFATGVTSSGGLNGFGLWNYGLFVDGTQYPASGNSTPPDPGGSFLIALGAGTHTIEALANSNVLIQGTSTQSETMGETVVFSTQAVPEPAPLAMLGLGVVGLLIRRRR